jgi:TrmH family RNA methyltransferase
MLSKSQIKNLQALQLKKFRDQRRCFIAEGNKTVSEILANKPEILQEIFATREFINKHSLQQKSTVLFTEVSEDELKKISLQTSPNMALAVCNYFEEVTPDGTLADPFTFYLDDIRDPGNFGTILRLAAWFGISTIYCSLSSCERYNPKVIQSTMGAFLRVNVHYTSLNELKEKANPENIYGGFLEGADLYSEKLSGGIIVIGNEANGISDENAELITRKITIPSGKKSGAESLNAAVAASIIAGEFFRQLGKR